MGMAMWSDGDDDSARYVRSKAVMCASLGEDDLALLSPTQGKYYGLDGPASRIWELLAEPRTLKTICEVLTQEFEVSAEQCRRESHEFLASLLAEKLVVVVEPKC